MTDLFETTKQLLAEASEPRHLISKHSGVGYEWLAKFAQGRMKDPGVHKVQKLHDYLSSQSNA